MGSESVKNNEKAMEAMPKMDFVDIEKAKSKEDEKEEETVGYPKSVAFIISNEFCERFNYYGMRTILVLYFTHKLGYTEETSTVLFHTFTTLVYLCPVFGALIADGWLGKFKTIFYLSLVYSLGAMIVSFGAIPLPGMPTKLITFVGLLLIAFGTGGIKPCVSAFGGDQFTLPQQSHQLEKFFSLFYFAINAGSMLSTAVTPMLRADVHCFGDADCFSLAFGIPAILMIVSVVIFLAGKNLYKRSPPSGNMIFGVSHCVTDAFRGWRKNRKTAPQKHFLDYARPTVGNKMVFETKCLVKILYLYLPFPVFWTLFDQQASRWTLQATRMNGNLWDKYTIKPDQMQVVNPLLILTFIPLFDYVIYPILRRIGVERPLQKLTIGGLLAALSFMLAAFVEMRLEMSEPFTAPPGPHQAHLRIYNGMPCTYEFNSPFKGGLQSPERVIDPLGMWTDLAVDAPLAEEYEFLAHSNDPNSKKCPPIKGTIRLLPGKSSSYFLAHKQLLEFEDVGDRKRNINNSPLMRALINTPLDEGPITLKGMDESLPPIKLDTRNMSTLHKVVSGPNELDINGRPAAEFELQNGGLYSLLVQGNHKTGYKYAIHEVGSPDSLSILWQLPQIVILTAAEIMFSITGLEFSFTQAPASMKSVLQACWLLSVSIGNMIVVFIAEVKFVETQSAEFGLYTAIMLVDMILFLFLARNYKYTDLSHADADDYDEDIESEGHDPKIVRASKSKKQKLRMSEILQTKDEEDPESGHAEPPPKKHRKPIFVRKAKKSAQPDEEALKEKAPHENEPQEEAPPKKEKARKEKPPKEKAHKEKPPQKEKAPKKKAQKEEGPEKDAPKKDQESPTNASPRRQRKWLRAKVKRDEKSPPPKLPPRNTGGGGGLEETFGTYRNRAFEEDYEDY